MNSPLRRRHQLLTLALAVALPAWFVVVLAQREPRPLAGALPLDPRAAGAVEALPAGVGVERQLESATGQRWSLRTNGARLAIAQSGGDALPDLLAYWSSRSATDELPADAVLLGAVAARERTFAVPRERGALILFSLARGEIAAQCKLEER